MVPYVINRAPTITFNTPITITGMDALMVESSVTDRPRNVNVASPAANPNGTNSFFEYPLSIALVANKLVQNTIVSGLDIVRRNADKKLER
jgi:hypothetical protein